jgi:hypothetical protein
MGINDNQAVDTVVERWINIEIKKGNTAWFTEFGVLLVEWWYSGSKVVE